MKILWINPSFLDYRIPLYDELNKLCNEEFYLIYSKNRIPERCHSMIQEVLGKNAFFLKKERLLSFGSESNFANTRITITFPHGLF